MLTRKTIAESKALILSIVKWATLATSAGAIVGGVVSLFLMLLNWGTGVNLQAPHFFWLLPVSLFLSATLANDLAPEAEGHGREKVIETTHKRAGKILVLVVPVRLIAALITLGCGGSAG